MTASPSLSVVEKEPTISGAEDEPEDSVHVYSSLKALAFQDRILALRERRLVSPVHIRIKPINHCNHDCWYCAYRVSNLQLGQDINLRDQMPREKMLEIIDDIGSMDVKAVTFSGGGEPLIYKPLPECIERLAGYGIRIGTLTNGSNLKGRMADAYAEHGTWIRVSIDGWDGESYAKSRNVSLDAFGKLLDNMEAFARRGTHCVLGASFIIGQANHGHIYSLCRTLKNAGVAHVKLAGVVIGNDGAGNNAYHRALQPRVGDEIERAKTLNDDTFKIIDHYHELDERFDRQYHVCPTVQFTPVIGADCMVYACQDKAYTQGGELGSIRDRSFKEVWFSPECRDRAYAIDPALHCRHNCASHQKNVLVTDFLGVHEDHLSFV